MKTKIVLMFLVGLMLTGSAIAGLSPEEALRVGEFMHYFDAVTESYWMQIDNIRQAQPDTVSDSEKREIVTQTIDLTNDLINELDGLSAPESCKKYKELMVQYFQLQLQINQIHLKVLTGSVMEVVKATDSVASKREQTNKLLEEAEKEYNRIMFENVVPENH